MQRVVILGCSGTGKSTLARKVGTRLNLPVIHLDSLFWEANWTESDLDVFRAKVKAALASGRWVTDGNYVTKTADLRYAQADAILWLDQPVWLRILRILRRTVIGLGRTRADMAQGCVERIDLKFFVFLKWTRDFDHETRPRIQAALSERFPEKAVTHLRGDAEIAAWLAGLPSP